MDCDFDKFTLWLNAELGQCIVAMFLFYSGYGISQGVRAKGKKFLDDIPFRAFKVLLRFDMAVLIFVPVNMFFGHKIPIKKILLSLICWDGIGNSNWYIFAIIALYLMTYVSYKWGKRPLDSSSYADRALHWVYSYNGNI